MRVALFRCLTLTEPTARSSMIIVQSQMLYSGLHFASFRDHHMQTEFNLHNSHSSSNKACSAELRIKSSAHLHW